MYDLKIIHQFGTDSATSWMLSQCFYFTYCYYDKLFTYLFFCINFINPLFILIFHFLLFEVVIYFHYFFHFLSQLTVPVIRFFLLICFILLFDNLPTGGSTVTWAVWRTITQWSNFNLHGMWKKNHVVVTCWQRKQGH